MITVKSEFLGLSPRKASLRNNRNYSEDFFETAPANLNDTLTSSSVRIKNTNVKSEIENNKRKRRESHDTSGSDKDESNRQQQHLIVPKPTINPLITSPAMEMKKCKFETERERMFRVSATKVTMCKRLV